LSPLSQDSGPVCLCIIPYFFSVIISGNPPRPGVVQGWVVHGVRNRPFQHTHSTYKYRKNSNKRTMCYVVRNFLLWKRGEKHTKKHVPRDKKKSEKTQTLLGEASCKSNVLAQGPFIRVFTVVTIEWLSPRPLRHSARFKM